MKPFEELDVIDDFLMNALASDDEIGEIFSKTLLKGLLQREVGNIRINVQQVIPGNLPTQRGIRMDVEIVEQEEEIDEISKENTDREIIKNIYDIEPHIRNNINLQKHNRFYQAKIDGRNMKSGEKDFVMLPNLYIITITNYDPFGYNYMMYTVHNKCDEIPELNYQDGLKFIYFNTKGTKGGTDVIKNLLNYLQESKINNVTDDITKTLHDCVCKVKTLPEVRTGYMTLEEKIFYERLDAKAEGLEESFRNIVIKLREKFSNEEIAELLKEPLERIESI